MTEYVYAAVTEFGEDGHLEVYTCRKVEDAKAAAQILLDAAFRANEEEPFPIVWVGDDTCWTADQTIRDKLHKTFDLEWTLVVERCEVLENLDFLTKKTAA